MYKSRKPGRIGSLVPLIVAIALAVALPLAAGAESEVALRGQVMSVVRLTVSKSEVLWTNLEPGINEMPNAFTVRAEANVGFHLNIQGTSSRMKNGITVLTNPVQYSVDTGPSFAALPETAVRIKTYSTAGPIDVTHVINLKQQIDYADPPLTAPGSYYSTTIAFSADQIVP